MGSSLSSSVDFKFPIRKVCTKSKHHSNLYHCGPQAQASPGKLNLGNLNYNKKLADTRLGAIPAVYVVPSKPSVLIVGEDDSDDSLSSYAVLEKARRCQLERCLWNCDDELEDRKCSFANFSDINQIRQEDKTIHNFIKAWKAGLSSYPHERIEKVCSDIPLAATAQCKQGISRCRRCQRLFIQCASAEQSEHLLDDLLHKNSLDRFLYETEFQQIASSIVVRQNLKLKQLYESVAHPDEDQGEETEEGVDPCEEDLTISFRFNLPPPVHLEHPVQDNLIHLPPPEVIHKQYDKHHQKEADLLEHDMFAKAHPTHGQPHQFHLNKIVEKVEKLMHLEHHHPAPETLTDSLAARKSVKKNLQFNLDDEQHPESTNDQHQDQPHDPQNIDPHTFQNDLHQDEHKDDDEHHYNNKQHDNKNKNQPNEKSVI